MLRGLSCAIVLVLGIYTSRAAMPVVTVSALLVLFTVWMHVSQRRGRLWVHSVPASF